MILTTRNKIVKEVQQLQKKAKVRNTEHLFIIEGIKMFSETPKEQMKKVIVSKSFLSDKKNKRMLDGLDYEEAEDFVFEAMSDTKTPQGILCIVRQMEYDLMKLLNKKRPLFLVLEELQDPGNLGTIMRTAEGAGVDGILLTKNSVDMYHPKTIRSTMGAIYRMPFFYFETIEEIVTTLQKADVRVFAAHLDGKNTYDEEDYKSAGCAFLIGNEGRGLTKEAASLSDTLIRIPMEGSVESLNAAVSAAILSYEAYRQRRH